MSKLFIIFLFIISYSLSAQISVREPNSTPNFILEPLADGFSNPVDIQNMGDERLFIVEQQGVIKILIGNTTIDTPFLDISSQVNFDNQEGLLGLTFHPDYVNNGYFFLNYINSDGNTQISRFTVSENPDIADVATELEILTIVQPFTNNNGGDLKFGPDGYLWIGTGDGGDTGDPQNNAQNRNSLLGKMLRIDVDNIDNGNNYAIPADNPYIDDAEALDEIWAYGLKNPRKFSFNYDTDEVWITDGGQFNLIEFNKVLSNSAGLNYGWRCYDNYDPFNIDECDEEDTMTFPFIEYFNTDIDCIKTGGIVYKGDEYPDMEESYIFADNCTGTMLAIWPWGDFFVDGYFSEFFTAFGEDYERKLYVASSDGAIKEVTIQWLANEEFNKDNFKITPNPSESVIYLELDNAILNSITIYGVNGNSIYSEKNMLTSKKLVDVSFLPSGLYMLKATSVAGISVTKKVSN